MDTTDATDPGPGPSTPTAPAPRGVLVTGASGYLGRLTLARLVDARAAGLDPIIACDLSVPPEAARLPGVRYEVVDVRDAGAVERAMGSAPIGVVVHLAAIVTPPRGAADGRALAWDVDVCGTRHVLDACVRAGVGKVIVTSSGAAYGYHADNAVPLDEDQPLRGNEVFAYSHHKRVVEQMLSDFRARHPELAQLVFRPGTILGAGTKNQITAIFERPVVMGIRGAASPFNFIWDEDVAACIVAGVKDPGLVGIYNLAGDGVMTLAEIAEALGKRFVAVPATVVRGALTVLGRLGLSPYGPEQVMFLQYRPVLDNRRLRERMGFTPMATRAVFELYRKSLASARS